jgi:hypothetical protein
MKLQTSDTFEEPMLDGNTIYISQQIRDWMTEGKHHFPTIIRGFRRNLHSRILGSTDGELKEMQGAIKAIGELENLFKNNS